MNAEQSPYVDRILAIVAQEFGCTSSDLLGRGGSNHVIAARYMAMAALQETLALTLEQIGQIFDGRDHTTIMFGLRRVNRVRDDYPRLTTNVSRRCRRAVEHVGDFEVAPEEPIKNWNPREHLGQEYLWGKRPVRAVAWHPARQLVAVTYCGHDGRQYGVFVAPDDLRYPLPNAGGDCL